MADFAMLIRKRASLKAKLTIFNNYLTNLRERLQQAPLDELGSIDLEIRINAFEALLTEYDEIQILIETDVSADPADQLKERETFETTFFNALSCAKQILKSYEASIVVTAASRSASPAATQVSGISAATSVANAQALGVKLPIIQLPKFDGNYEGWLEYRDTFESLIHNNDSINDIQKFHYLRASLNSGAKEVIKALEFSANNYQVAWDLLCARYDNKRLLINNHVKAIFNFEPIPKESSIGLRKLLDGVTKHLRALNTLEQPTDYWDTLIIHLIVTKLDLKTSREWEEKKGNEIPTLEVLKEFLKNRADLLETLELNQLSIKPKLPHKERSTRSFVATKANCAHCKGDHYIQNCNEFLKLSATKRIEAVKSLNLCSNCLRSGHFIKDCRFGPCRKCSNKHNTLLHADEPQSSNTNASGLSNESIALTTTQNLISNKVLLATALVYVFDKNGTAQNARVLLDPGSQSSFVTTDLARKLNLPQRRVDTCISGINEGASNATYKCEVDIASQRNNFSATISCLILKNITGHLPNFAVKRENIFIPVHIHLADPNFHQAAKIDMLIGGDWFWDLLCTGQRKLGKYGPVLQNTKLGWILSGPIETNHVSSTKINCHLTTKIERQLARFWDVENVAGENKILSNEEMFCEEHFKKTLTHDGVSGKFIVSIPFKKNVSFLGSSRQQAERRFFSLERKLLKNPHLRTKYFDFMQEYLALGHMKKIDEKSDELTHVSYYMPHHGVLKEDRLTTKIRVVFDASATTSSGYSLNDLQAVGPTIQHELFSILIRFRKYKYAICADVEKMYRQVLVRPEETKLQRILWRTDPSAPLDAYELQTVTYGTAAAAFLAIRSLHQIAEEIGHIAPQISEIIKTSFYVDDLITGADTVSDGIRISSEISEVLSKRIFHLRKWVSNAPEIVKNIVDEAAPKVLDLGVHENTKTLGLFWNSVTDDLLYSISNNYSPKVTKRTILSEISQIFDPLGLLSPCVIIVKVMLQKLWLAKLSWDQSLPLSLHTEWLTYRDNLKHLNKIRITRRVICNEPVSIELHGFSDASQEAYGACLYLRSEDADKNVTVHLLCSKSKVAPLKTITIPRLELCGAMLLAKLMSKIKIALNMEVDRCIYWTDSTVVLGWLNTSPHLLQTFVGNRVAQAIEISDIGSWKHVPTSENPADMLSRGVNPKFLKDNSMWWYGPNWLKEAESCWPSLDVARPIILPELRKGAKALTAVVTENFPFQNFSSLSRLQRIVAYCKRFFFNCRNSKFKITGPLTSEELRESLSTLVKISQRESFYNEMQHLKQGKPIKGGNLVSLCPFLDENDILRVGGRLGNSNFLYSKRHPILLAGKHQFTKLLFLCEHQRLLHTGPQHLLASIRERYWPLSGRNLAKKITRECVTCFKAMPKCLTPIMGSLPSQRVTPMPPFNCSGVDYAGPFSVKDRQGRGCKITKAYLAVFICFCTKAIHLELVSSLSKEAFIAALNRFCSRRGKPSEIFSDNGTNFTSANSELLELGNFLRTGELGLTEAIENQGIKWHFIPPSSPHFGGLWEAGVKSAKFHLKRVAGNAIMTFEQLYTLLTQVEAVLNSRPLFPLSNDPSDLSALTPSHFLIGRSSARILEPDLIECPENRLSYWQRIQQLHQHFWCRWSKEYISEMQQRSKWMVNVKPISENQLVLIKDDNLPPLRWKLGRIISQHPGKDGVARVATIRTAGGDIRRAFAKICPLPVQSA